MANYIVSCLSGWSNDVCQRMEAENVLHSLIYLLSNSEISKSLTNMVMQFILYLKCWLVIFLFHRSKMILFPTQILDILTRILDPSKEMKSKVWSYHSLVLRESSNSFYNLSEWLFSFWVIFSFIMDQLMGWQRNGVQQEMQGWLEMKMRKLHQQPGFMFVSMFCTPPLPFISMCSMPILNCLVHEYLLPMISVLQRFLMSLQLFIWEIWFLIIRTITCYINRLLILDIWCRRVGGREWCVWLSWAGRETKH